MGDDRLTFERTGVTWDGTPVYEVRDTRTGERVGEVEELPSMRGWVALHRLSARSED